MTAAATHVSRQGQDPQVGDDRLLVAALGSLRAFAALADRTLTSIAPGITQQQYRALTLLAEGGSLTASALAEALGVAPSTATRLGDRLLRDGLISRGALTGDRRIVIISLTRRGTGLVERVRGWRLQQLSELLATISGAARDALAADLDRCNSLLTGIDPATSP